MSVRRAALSAEQRKELEQHLAEPFLRHGESERRPLFDERWQLDAAIDTLARAFEYAATVKCIPAAQMRKRLKTSTSRSKAITRHAAALRKLLNTERPIYRTAGLNWSALDHELGQVAEGAELEVQSARRITANGRPPLEWRDSLIAITYTLYPPAQAKATREHFRTTVDLLLKFLGQENTENLPSVIAAALKRRQSLARRPSH